MYINGISEKRSPNFQRMITTMRGNILARLMINDNVEGNVHRSGAILTINGNSIQTLFKSIQVLKLSIIIRVKQTFSAHLRGFEFGLWKMKNKKLLFHCISKFIPYYDFRVVAMFHYIAGSVSMSRLRLIL
jgi:hypothetical protein